MGFFIGFVFADVFDKDGSGDVDFDEFIQGLSTFGSEVEKTEKLSKKKYFFGFFSYRSGKHFDIIRKPF